MECKEKQIRLNGYNCNRIGIYPEWNVKLERYNKKIDGVYNWNISRMECKDNEEEDKYILSSGLEYIQNGM